MFQGPLTRYGGSSKNLKDKDPVTRQTFIVRKHWT